MSVARAVKTSCALSSCWVTPGWSERCSIVPRNQKAERIEDRDVRELLRFAREALRALTGPRLSISGEALSARSDHAGVRAFPGRRFCRHHRGGRLRKDHGRTPLSGTRRSAVECRIHYQRAP